MNLRSNRFKERCGFRKIYSIDNTDISPYFIFSVKVFMCEYIFNIDSFSDPRCFYDNGVGVCLILNRIQCFKKIGLSTDTEYASFIDFIFRIVSRQ